MSKSKLTPEDNVWCETLCKCGHMRVWHLHEDELAGKEWDFLPPVDLDIYETFCVECIDEESEIHEFEQNNLSYLELMSNIHE